MLQILKVIVLFLPCVLLIAEFLHPITSITQDLGRHLKMGEIIISTLSIPTTNLFSYTYPDFPFINHHWFSEVIFYVLFTIGGYNVLLITTVITVFLAFFCVFFFSLKRTQTLIIVPISFLLLSVLYERTEVRPEIFSFLFTAVFSVVLYTYRERYTRFIYLLVLLQLLWVNTHIYFIIGIVMVVLFCVDYLISNYLLILSTVKKSRTLPKQFLHLCIVVLLLIIISMINPHGLQGMLYPLFVFNNYGYTIEENQTIFFLDQIFPKSTILYFKISIILLFIALFINIKKSRPIDWLISIIFTILGASAVRNFPIFVFAVFIPLVYNINLAIRRIQTYYNFEDKTQTIFSNVFALLLIIFSLYQIIQANSQKPFGVGVVKGAGDAADFFISHQLSGPIFNNFDIGSYLDYRLYPHEKVFVDGRPEAYPTSFFKDTYIPMQEDPKNFEEVDRKYNFNAIFFSHTDQTPWGIMFLKHIVKNSNFTIVYLDDFIVILVKNNKNNAEIIKQFSIHQRSNQSIIKTLKDPLSLYRLARFFTIASWNHEAIQTYKKILASDPTSCHALYNLSLLLFSEDNPNASLYSTKYQYHCK